MNPVRIRIRFAKEGDFRFTSHRDLVRAVERTIRRAGISLRMSEGFHPKPRMSFPLALALGVVAQEEVMELELADLRESPDLLERLRRHAPAGLIFLSAEHLPPGARSARVARVVYDLRIPAHRRAPLKHRIEQFLADSSCCVARPDRGTTVDIRPLVEDLRLVDESLRMTLSVTPDRTARPREVLQAIDLADLEEEGGVVVRTRVELAES
jgi:radical SAM-linked protein